RGTGCRCARCPAPPPAPRRPGRPWRRALQSLRGPNQLVEVRDLRVLVAPGSPNRALAVDEESGAPRDVLETPEIPRNAKALHRLAVPVREQSEVQIERLHP